MSQEDRDRLADILARVDALETELVGKLDDAYLERAIPAAQVADELAGKLNGAVGVKLDQVSALVAKLGVKASRKAAEKLYSAYSYGQNVLPGFPTMEQVAYGNATGDYVGSMGFIPTGENAPQIAIGESPGPLATDGSQETTDAPAGGGFEPVPTYTPPPALKPIAPPPAIPPGPVTRIDWQPGIHPFPTVDFGPQCLANPATHGWMENPGFQWWPADWGIGGPVVYDNNNVVPVVMLHPGESCPYGSELHCLDACAFGEQPETAHVNVCIPPGTQILINPATGQMVAAAINTTLLSLGWRYAYKGDCSTSQIFVTPSGPPTLPPTQPPTDPNKCVPVCPTPGPLDCGPTMVFPGVQIKDLGTDVCKDLEAGVKALSAVPFALTSFMGMGVGKVCDNATVNGILTALTGHQFPALPDLSKRLGEWLVKIVNKVTEGMDCDRATLTPVALTQAGLRFLDQWFGIIPPQATESVRQISNFICQSLLPTIPQAHAAWLAKEIDDKEWECWVKAQGGYVEPQKKLRDAGRTRPDAFQLARLLRRKKIEDQEYKDAIRQQGVSDQTDGSRIYDLTAAWPGLEDTIRMMVRDVADPNAVELGGLDEDFDKKWQGKLKELGEGNGVDAELAKLYWRAHWRLPSFTQLSEMLHRLRPGRVPQAEAVTAKMVEDTLKMDDMAPAWVKRLMAVSYRTVTRTDAVKMYSLRTIDNAGLKDYIQDEGFPERDADNLVAFFEKNRNVQEIRRSGLPPPRALVTRYAKGLMSRDEFERIVSLITFSDEQANAMKEAGELEKRVLHRTRILAATKKALMRGVLDESDAHAQLAQADIDPGEAAELVADWMEEREAMGKLATTAKLCQWRTMGILTATEHAKALDRLNWSPFQAERIMAECEIREFERQKKLLEIAQAKAQAAADKKERERLACLPKDEACRQKGYPTRNGSAGKKSSA